MDNGIFSLVYLILSTMIGAGILALPYVFFSTGILSSLILFLLSALIIYFSSIIFLKASIKCYKATIQEIFGRYLGEKIKKITFFITTFSIIFVCVAYLNVINFSLKSFVKQSEICTLLVAVFMMIIAFLGFNLVEKSEKILFTLKIIIIFLFLFFVIFVPKKYTVELFTFNLKNYFQFLLISTFAFSFYTVIPSLLYITRDEKKLRISIKYSLIIAFFLYFLFSYIVSFRSGNSEISTLSFSELFNILTIFLVITPYLILSWVLSEIFAEQLKIEKNVSLLISFGTPLFLFTTLPKSFLIYLEITSAFFILSIYLLIGIIGYKFSERLRINKVVSLILIVFSLSLIIFEILSLLNLI